MSTYNRFDRSKIKFKPLKERHSKIRIEDTARNAYNRMKPISFEMRHSIASLTLKIKEARDNNRPVILCMGAHPVKNGACLIINDLVNKNFITHVAGNGASAIHDWEFAFLGKSTECVKTNASIGEFGIWKETGEFFANTASHASNQGCSWGELIGLWMQDKIGGSYKWGEYSVMLNCYKRGIPFTIHPGIGQDIIYSHPSLNNMNCTIVDFEIFAESVRNLEGGVYLSVGSSVMSPMIFEKALSMARNVEMQEGRNINAFMIAVNDLADSNWDWSKGEPPMDNPAYYLRFMKTFHRMGGTLEYFGIHNIDFLKYLHCGLT